MADKKKEGNKMKKLLLAVLAMVPSICHAGFFSDYDSSKLSIFKDAATQHATAPLDQKQKHLSQAAAINSDIQSNCAGINPSHRYYYNECMTAYRYTSSALAEMYLYQAKSLMSAKKLDEAKSVLRSTISGFVGDNFKSTVKEAEFLLADVEKELSAKSAAQDQEKLRLQLELEKTRLELEKLRAQTKNAAQ